MKKEVSVIHEQEVLGKDFKVYGDLESPLFLAKSVAEWIDYGKKANGSYDVYTMLKTVDDDEKLMRISSASGQRRNVWFLTEFGLYEVLMQSHKPLAKEFKKRVKVILKEIRLTGSYNTPAPVVDSYMIEDSVKRAERWIEEQKEKQALALTIEVQKPLVEYGELYVKEDVVTRLIGNFAKDAKAHNHEFDLGSRKIFPVLREWGYLNSDNSPSQYAIDKGWFVPKKGKPFKDKHTGEERYTVTPHITPSGEVQVVKRYLKEKDTKN